MDIYVNFKEMDDAKTDFNIIKKNTLEQIDVLEGIVNETHIDWRGTDADSFIATTRGKIKDVRTDYDEYLTEVENEMERNAHKFEETQRRNLNIINEK